MTKIYIKKKKYLFLSIFISQTLAILHIDTQRATNTDISEKRPFVVHIVGYIIRGYCEWAVRDGNPEIIKRSRSVILKQSSSIFISCQQACGTHKR